MGQVRETWVFPSDGSEPFIKGTREYAPPQKSGQVFMPDLPDFVSPVDGKRYSGRAGMREHNKRHDVVPVEDLKGLPPLTMHSDTRSPQEKRASEQHRKQTIINQVNRHYQG
tara:strand:+ start:32584 stop:32919 length:336 start_codon:yes stop_codon:yes gene_type:complete